VKVDKIKKIALEKFAAVQKIMLIILLGAVAGGGIFFAYRYFTAEEEFKPTEILDTVTAAKEKPAEHKKPKVEKVVAMTIPENPFITNKQLSAKAAEKTQATAEVKTVTQSQPSTQMVLPQIPKTQVVPSQQVKIPSAQIGERKIVNPLTMETMETKPEGNVQGIITADNGKNIAIMSNGEVLTEGERYLDGRIAYIGGDGIEMDNGKKIKMKE